MRTADLTLRYQQDSTLMAHRVLLQEQKNEVLVLRQTQFVVFAVAVVSILTAVFLYRTAKRNVLCCLHGIIAQSLHFVWRISVTLVPHFIFNVLNREIGGAECRRKARAFVAGKTDALQSGIGGTTVCNLGRGAGFCENIY